MRKIIFNRRRSLRLCTIFLCSNLAVAPASCPQVWASAQGRWQERFNQGTDLLKQGNSAGADQAFQQAANQASGFAHADQCFWASLIGISESRINSGKFAEAEEPLRKALDLCSGKGFNKKEKVSVLWLLGLSLLRQGKSREAVSILESAASMQEEISGSSSIEYARRVVVLLEAYREASMWKEATLLGDKLTPTIKTGGQDRSEGALARDLEFLALANLKLGSYDQVLKICDLYMNLPAHSGLSNDWTAEVVLDWARALKAQNVQPAEWLSKYKQAVDLFATMSGNAFLDRRLAAMEEMFAAQAAAKQDGEAAQTLNQIADLYDQEYGKTSEAAIAAKMRLLSNAQAFNLYNSVVPFMESLVQTLSNAGQGHGTDLARSEVALAIAYAKQSRYQEAVKVNKQALATASAIAGPTSEATASIARNLAQCLGMTGDYQQAAGYVARALAVMPDDFSTLRTEIVLLLCQNQKGTLDNKVAKLHRLLQNNTTFAADPDNWNFIGWLELMRGSLAQSEDAFKKAYDLADAAGDVRLMSQCGLAIITAKRGDTQAALDILKNNPQGSHSHYAGAVDAVRSEIFTAGRRNAEAQEQFKQSVKELQSEPDQAWHLTSSGNGQRYQLYYCFGLMPESIPTVKRAYQQAYPQCKLQ